MDRPDRTTLLGAAASVALVVGAYLPWIRDNPAHTGGQPAVLLAGMRTGFEADQFVLLAAFVAFLASFLQRWQGLRALAHLAGGGVATFLVTIQLRDSLVGFGPGYPFTFGVGWYVALAGGLLLVLLGLRYVAAELRVALAERSATD